MDDFTRRMKLADQKAEAIRATAQAALEILASADDHLSMSERHALRAKLEGITTNAAHVRNELVSYAEAERASDLIDDGCGLRARAGLVYFGGAQ